MKLEADTHVPFPREVVFRAYRDHLVDLLPYLPNVRGIEIASREDAGTVTRLENIWRGGGEIPAAARAVLSESMLNWTDYATWDEAAWSCTWRIETHAFTDAVRCAGRNTFHARDGGTLLEIRGEITIDGKKIKGVPGFMAGTVAKTIEQVLVGKIQPNLVETARGLEKYLAANGPTR
jgi:hypothetical protein